MTRILSTIPLLITLLAASAARGDLPAFEREVVADNPALQAARARVRAADARIRQAGAWDDSRISTSATSGGDLSAEWSQALPTSGRLGVAVRRARLELAQERERVRREELDLLLRTRQACNRLALGERRLALNRASIAWVAQARVIAEQRFANNAGSQAPVLAADSAAARLEADRSRILQTIQSARAELNALRNRPSSTPIPAVRTGSSVAGALIPGADAALAHRPEMELARLDLEAARAAVDLARREGRAEPDLALGVDRTVDSGEPMNAVTVGVSIGLPWLNRGKYHARIREALALVDAAALSIEARRADTLRMHADLVARVHAARDRLGTLRDRSVPAARRAFDAALAAYASGAGDYTEVNEAFRMRLDAENEVIEADAELFDVLAEARSLAGDAVSPGANRSTARRVVQ